MPATQQRVRFTVWVLGIVAAGVAAMAMHQAIRWYDHPVAGMLVTADLEVASVGEPSWDAFAHGLAYPDRVLGVDGLDLTALQGAAAIEAWGEAVESAVRRGARSVHARVRTRAGVRELDLRIDRLAPAVWWLYGGGLVFT